MQSPFLFYDINHITPCYKSFINQQPQNSFAF